MPYDPFKHNHRSIRLRGYDYTQAGAYFVTILTHNRECLFGDVADGAMRVNAFGQIVAECWDALPTHFPNVELDAFVVMPNHVHGVIVIAGGAPLQPGQPRGTQTGSIGAIIQNFKSVSTRKINAARDAAGASVWHRNYHEHIIRHEKSLNAIRKYIEGNPTNWANDEDNLVNIRRRETIR